MQLYHRLVAVLVFAAPSVLGLGVVSPASAEDEPFHYYYKFSDDPAPACGVLITSSRWTQEFDPGVANQHYRQSGCGRPTDVRAGAVTSIEAP